MTVGVHGVGPLGLDNASFCQVLADFGGWGGRLEGAVIDEEGFMVDGGVGDVVPGRDLLAGYLEGEEWCYSDWHECGVE